MVLFVKKWVLNGKVPFLIQKRSLVGPKMAQKVQFSSFFAVQKISVHTLNIVQGLLLQCHKRICCRIRNNLVLKLLNSFNDKQNWHSFLDLWQFKVQFCSSFFHKNGEFIGPKSIFMKSPSQYFQPGTVLLAQHSQQTK